MDRDIDVRTPESIAIRYELAGLGSRFLAVTIDLVLQVLLLLLLAYGVSLLPSHGVPKASPQVERFALNVVIGLLIVTVFLIFFGYFIVFEAAWNGQTPGKRLLGIRVVRDGGYPVDFSASLVRNLIRIGEWLLGGYIIAAVCALVSNENKRVGDLAAGTIVVRDARMVHAAALLRDLREQPAAAATTYLNGEERGIVARFLERRDRLAPEPRRALAAQIARRVRSRLPADVAALDDEALLERL